MDKDDIEAYGDDLHEELENSKEPQKIKKSRGATVGKRMKKMSCPMYMEFDTNGRPCGPWKDKYSTQVGILGRAVDINIDEWKKVPEGLKDTIWLDIQKTFNIDEFQKSNVLGHVASCWKSFKTNLTSKFIYKTRKQTRKVPLDDPLSLYSFISKEQWEKFKMSREDESFKKKSEAGRAAQKFNLHPHYLGRSGYSGKREQWLQEEITAASKSSSTITDDASTDTSLSTYLSSLLSDRSYNWIRAHTPSAGKEIPTQTQELINEIERWQEKEKQGEFVADRFEDVLTMATKKKDYPGRTRGVGSRVRLRTYFGLPKDDGHRGQRFTAEDMKLFEQQVAERVKKETMAEVESMMEQKALSILKLAGVNVPLDVELNKTHTGSDSSNCHSVDPNPFDKAQGPLPCQLGIELDSNDFVVVAKGTFFPSKVGDMVHNVPLMPHHVKVCIDQIIKPNASLPVPFGGFTMVGEVEGSFGQWPKEWVEIGDEVHVAPKKKAKTMDDGKKKKDSCISDTQGPLVSIEKYRQMGLHSRSLHDMLKRTQKSLFLYNVKLPKELYHYEHDMEVPVLVEDIVQMFDLQWLNISILQIWGRYLYNIGENLGVDNVGYLCPERLSIIERASYESETYIIDALVSLSGKKFILAPYHETEHWMLIVICPGRNEAYLMDPRQSTPPKNIKLKKHLNVAFRVYCQRGGKHDVKKGTSLSWPKTMCPQQPGSYECAYYVMKFMYEIILCHMKKEELTKCFKAPSYPMAEINHVRDIWSEYFMDFCI